MFPSRYFCGGYFAPRYWERPTAVVTPPADTGVYILGGGSVNGNVSSIEAKKKRKKKKKADLFAIEKKRFDIQQQYEEEMLLMACLEEWN